MLTIFCFLSVIKLTNLQADTEMINDYQELQRNLEPQRQIPHVLWSQRCKVKLDCCITLSAQVSQSTQVSLPYKSQPIREDELMRLQPAR